MTDLIFSEKMRSDFVPIDEQHQKLLNIFQDFCQIASSNNKNLIKQQFEEIMELAVFHFAFEQTLMLYTEYPLTKTYINTHNRLLQRVGIFYNDFLADKQNTLNDFIAFLTGWIKTHIPLEANTYIGHIKEYFAQMSSEQQNEYIQDAANQFKDLNAAQITARLQEIINSYGLD